MPVFVAFTWPCQSPVTGLQARAGSLDVATISARAICTTARSKARRSEMRLLQRFTQFMDKLSNRVLIQG